MQHCPEMLPDAREFFGNGPLSEAQPVLNERFGLISPFQNFRVPILHANRQSSGGALAFTLLPDESHLLCNCVIDHPGWKQLG